MALFTPRRILGEVTPVSSTAEKIEQAIYFVEKNDKRKLLIHLLKDRSIGSALVFTRTKHGADRVAKDLTKAGIQALAIHGNKSQNARQNALSQFKGGRLRVLVATDIAARGIDVEELSHVINYEIPNVPETYVHRIGRTGRAGLSGIALSFCDAEEKEYLRDIQKLIGKTVPVITDQPYPMSPSMASHSSAPKQNNGARKNGNARPNNGQKKTFSSNSRSAPSSGGGGTGGKRKWWSNGQTDRNSNY